MPLNKPVSVWVTDTNAEAQMLRNVLAEAGIEAYVTEDLSLTGMAGASSSNDLPQVWVDSTVAEQAVALLTEIDRRLRERSSDGIGVSTDQSPPEGTCERCGKASTFAPEYRGTVQECPHCGAFMDVGDLTGEWDVGEESGE